MPQRNRKTHKGISLLEVTIALALLALVLITSAHIRFSLLDKDTTYQSELSSLVVLRQAAMDFETGILAPGFTNASGDVITNQVTTNGYLESGDGYTLTSMLQTNNLYSLGLYRMDFDLSSGNYRQPTEERFSMYGSRVKIQPPPWDRPSLAEPPLNAAASLFLLEIKTEPTNTDWGTITVAGYVTNALEFTTNYAYGSVLTITALPKTNSSYHFVGWSVSPSSHANRVDNTNDAQTTVFVDDEMSISAHFQ